MLGDQGLEHAVDKEEGRGGGRLLPLAVDAGARRGGGGGRGGRGGGVAVGIWEGGACLGFWRAVGGWLGGCEWMHGKPCMQMVHTIAHTDTHALLMPPISRTETRQPFV